MLPAVIGNSCTPPSTLAMSSGFIAASLAPKSTVWSIDALDAAAAADRLIVDQHVLVRGAVGLEPLVVERRRKAGAGALQLDEGGGRLSAAAATGERTARQRTDATHTVNRKNRMRHTVRWLPRLRDDYVTFM